MAVSYKKNKVKCDIGSYIHYWRGIKKVGKTTLFYNLVKEQYKDLDKGLLISIGDEIGFNALDDLNYVETPTWSDLEEVVEDLVENKADNVFEIVGLDTADEMIKLAKEEVKRLHRKAKGTTVEFNACFGGYGAPRDKVNELIDDVLARLRKAGYGIVIIGHTAIRNIKEKNGDEYQQLTSNLNSDYDGIFANKADIVMTIAVEKDIDENKHISGTTRYMWFRTDGFVDAGGRFDTMPEKVEYGARNYIEAVEEGIRKAMKTPISDEELAKRKKDEIFERKAKAAEFAEETSKSKNYEELSAKYIHMIQKGFSKIDSNDKKEIKDVLSEYGAKKITDDNIPLEALEKIANITNKEK